MSGAQKSAINRMKAAQQANNINKQTSKSDSSSASASSGSSNSVRARTTRSRWALDLSEGRASSSTFLSTGHALLDVVPTGYTPGAVDGYNREDEKTPRDEAKHADLIYNSAMSIAKAPGQQLLMTAFMLWMSGNSLQIFSIMMLSMALWKPISEMLNVQTRFARFADSGVDMTLPKITFIALHLAGLALGLYKCNTMGLLPTSTADWVDSSLRTAVQVSGGGVV